MLAIDPLFLSYLTVTFLLVVPPGSTTAVVVRNALAGGRTAGVSTAAGAALANATHACAAGLGLAVLLGRWPGAVDLVRIAGALYLLWLGLSSLFAALRAAERSNSLGQHVTDDGGRAGFRDGLTVNLLNPAIVTFYLVVVPSFMPIGAPRWHFAFLAAIQIAMAFACHSVWALAFERVRHVFDRPVARQALAAATGVTLLVLALRVLVPI